MFTQVLQLTKESHWSTVHHLSSDLLWQDTVTQFSLGHR